jgi:hypothetical protein
VRFAVATPADDVALRRLLRENPMPGAISLSFEREPDYFRGAAIADAADATLVAYDGDALACMGRVTTRPCWINGECRRVSYLGELRLDAAAQGRVDVLRGGYRYFHDLHRRDRADLTFTSIAADNVRARRLFERGVAGLPRYEFLTEFVTLLIPVPPRGGRAGLTLASCPAGELVEFLNSAGRAHHLATAWTLPSLLALAQHGLPVERFRVLRRDGRIVACAALWDQRAFRQTVIRGYTPALSRLRPVINFASRLFGMPRLPKPGAVLTHAFLSPLVVLPEAESLLPDLVAAHFPEAAQRGLDFLTVGFAADDSRLTTLRRRFRGRTYRSRLYRVGWPDDPVAPALDNRLILPEVALL